MACAEYNRSMVSFLSRLSQSLQKNKTAPPDSRMQPGVGDTVNQRYRLDIELGRGGMGIVFRAYDMLNERDVAVKIVNVETANALTLQQFTREAEITLQLKHPHIVAVYETGLVGASPFLVMEYVQGAALGDMRGFTYARVIDIGKQICEALAYAHDKGFVHRDLKPGNVLLEKRGLEYFVKLMDFGLARPRGEQYLPAESSLAGTVFYLAPEVIAGQPADVSSDLYAVGAMMYEMITGRVPFSNFDEQTVLSQHLEDEVSPPSDSRHDIPPALDEIVMRLLAKSPKDRFESAEAVRQALERISLSSGAARSNLPQSTTDLSGRESDLAHIIQMLEANQFVTLTADDWVLSREAGTRLIDQFADGVWLVDFSSVNDPSMVLAAAASALGVPEDPNRSPAILLINNLREKNILLLLNHCDHVIGACKQLVETILRTCPDIKILVTSDQPLNISL